MNPTLASFDTAGTGWAGATSAAAPQAVQKSAEQMATKEMFLQLLVAQIRHQNPLNPANGTEFVAQLAQFTQLEATLDIRKDLDQIREALTGSAAGETQAP